MSFPKGSSVNTGIQADTVTAEVMAVGSHARASKTVNFQPANPELADIVAELRTAISAMRLEPPAKEALEEDISTLDSEAIDKSPAPDRVGGILRSIVGKLKMVGVVMSDAAAIAGPIKKIAELFGVPFPG